MSAYTGYLIRRERLARNLSQEGLAKGICAVSYLSKIEQGQVEPGQEIIDRLFAALHIDFVREPELEKEAERTMERFFFLSEAGEPYEEEAAFFEHNGEKLMCSEFALAYQVCKLCMMADQHEAEAARLLLKQIEPFLSCLSGKLCQRVLMVKASFQEELKDTLSLLEAAEKYGIDCVLLYWKAICVYRMGAYSQSVELAEKAYHMACEDGNIHIMLWSTHLLGSCACNRYDMELAERHYRRAMALSRGYRTDISSYAYYNLGSTYLEIGDNPKAFHYLSRVKEQKDDWHHNVMQHQKMAILCVQLGKTDDAQKHLDRARELCGMQEYCNWPRYRLIDQMVRFAELLYENKGADDPEFETVALKLYRKAGDAYGHGFKQFYGHYLIELYKRQRRYKEALRVFEEIQSHVS